ncbi:hypothetical protein J6590_012784 [Homalodisca vitripennis]|nr:hypothetical protein J6590_012784 [Homalodisca vitripennis]
MWLSDGVLKVIYSSDGRWKISKKEAGVHDLSELPFREKSKGCKTKIIRAEIIPRAVSTVRETGGSLPTSSSSAASCSKVYSHRLWLFWAGSIIPEFGCPNDAFRDVDSSYREILVPDHSYVVRRRINDGINNEYLWEISRRAKLRISDGLLTRVGKGVVTIKRTLFISVNRLYRANRSFEYDPVDEMSEPEESQESRAADRKYPVHVQIVETDGIGRSQDDIYRGEKHHAD